MRNDRNGSRLALTRRQLMAAAGVSALGASALPSPVRAADQKLVVSIGTDIVSLDPDQYASWNDYWAYGNMFEGLYGPDQKGQLVPALAEALTVSPDGLSYTFTLRDAKFHNGDPVTSDDVDFSLKRSLDPKTRNQRAALIGASIDRLEIHDDKHFTVHLKQIDSETLTKLSLYWQVKPKKYIQSVGDAGFAAKPVGTGPFQFAERKPSEYFTVRAFADYWGGTPKIQEITIRIVPEEQSRLAQVLAGEADVATPVSPVIAARMKAMAGPKIVDVPALLNVVLKLNPGHPEIAKQPVRQALAMAIDREAMLKTIMLGFAAPQELWCTEAQPACTAGDPVTPYKYDPDRAKALLKQANFDFSKPLKFVGQAPGRVAASKETCEAIADYFKRVGINVDLQILEFGAWNAILNAKPPKDPSVAVIFATAPDPSLDVAYKLLVNTKAGAIPSWVIDDDVDKMLAKIDSFTDMKARDQFMNQILKMVHDKALVLPLWADNNLFATAKSVNFTVPPYLSYTALRWVTKT